MEKMDQNKKQELEEIRKRIDEEAASLEDFEAIPKRRAKVAGVEVHISDLIPTPKVNESEWSNNTLYLPKEKIWINPKVAKLRKVSDIIGSIPAGIQDPDFIKNYGEPSRLSYQCPVANTCWDFLEFLDVDIFRPAAMAYEESERAVSGTNLKPSYTPHIPGTIQHKKFWKTELKRIINGYEPIVDGQPCGLRISGEFYFFLNYCVIDKMEKDANGEDVGVRSFPNFLAMDYYFFREIDARERPTNYNLPKAYKAVGITVAKSRRKGFSFKAAAGTVWVTAFPKSRKSSPPNVLIASDTGNDAVLCFQKAVAIVGFLSEKTPFGRKDPGNPRHNGGWKHIPMTMTKEKGHFTFGIQSTKNSSDRRGRLATFSTVSLNSRPDKAAGQGADRVYFEEAGKTSNLKDAWEFTRPVLKPGAIIKGIAIIFGTGGEMVKSDGDKGHSDDFARLFKEPASAELAAFDNIYEYEPSENKAGWFVPEMWACFGAQVVVDGKLYEALDKNGNPNFWVAELYINYMRKIKKEAGDKAQYDKYLTQYCKTPSEAFLTPEGNIFPVADLYARDMGIRLARHGYEGIRSKGELVETNGYVDFKIDLANKLQPIDTRAVATQDREGCILRYEAPMKIAGRVPEGAYIIAVDPIGQDTSAGKSMTSIIVMKTPKYVHTFGPSKIVCTYRGRAKDRPQRHIHEMLMKLSKYYNAKITFENDRDGGILQYFIRKGEVARLMPKPEMTISKYMPNSKTLLREYGHSMATPRHKQIGEDLVLEWLLTRLPDRTAVNEFDEVVTIPGVRNLDLLEDRALIEELMAYNRQGNFDVVMALMGAVIQLNEYYNEDFIEEMRSNTGVKSVSNFWQEVFYDNYGTAQEKRAFETRKRREKNINPRDISYHKDI
jgi:hypothetical protein